MIDSVVAKVTENKIYLWLICSFQIKCKQNKISHFDFQGNFSSCFMFPQRIMDVSNSISQLDSILSIINIFSWVLQFSSIELV